MFLYLLITIFVFTTGTAQCVLSTCYYWGYPGHSSPVLYHPLSCYSIRNIIIYSLSVDARLSSWFLFFFLSSYLPPASLMSTFYPSLLPSLPLSQPCWFLTISQYTPSSVSSSWYSSSRPPSPCLTPWAPALLSWSPPSTWS